MPKRQKRPRLDGLSCDGTGCPSLTALNWNVGKLARSGLFCDRAACRREAGVAGIYKRKADRPPSPPRDSVLRRTNYAAPLQQQIPCSEARPPPSPQRRPYVPAKQPRPLSTAVAFNATVAAAPSFSADSVITSEPHPWSTVVPLSSTAAAPVRAVPLAVHITPRLLFTVAVAFTGMHKREPSDSELRAQVERCLNMREGDVMRYYSALFAVARAGAVALHADRAIALHGQEQRTQARVVAALKDLSARRQALHPRDINVQ